jgi:hypothetical protein
MSGHGMKWSGPDGSGCFCGVERATYTELMEHVWAAMSGHDPMCDEFPPVYVPEAEGLCICGLLEQARKQERLRIRALVQSQEAILAVKQALHAVYHPDLPWEEAVEDSPGYLDAEVLAVLAALLELSDNWKEQQ